MVSMESYSLNMDFVREEFDLPVGASLYDCVDKLVTAYKSLKDEKQINDTVKKETICPKPRKITKKKSKK